MNRATLGLLILFQIAWTWTLSLYIRLGLGLRRYRLPPPNVA